MSAHAAGRESELARIVKSPCRKYPHVLSVEAVLPLQTCFVLLSSCRYDHVAVGTGTVVNKTAIKQYQQATRDRSKVKTEGGKIIRWECHVTGQSGASCANVLVPAKLMFNGPGLALNARAAQSVKPGHSQTSDVRFCFSVAVCHSSIML